jgi:GNAT superfamily N-acetyltransferase
MPGTLPHCLAACASGYAAPMPRPPRRARYLVTTDPRRFDVDRVWRWLRGTEWAAGIPRALVDRAIRGALCFAILDDLDRQLGFARVITDRATFAYVADVFVDEAARGRGLAKRLMRAIVGHPELRGLRRWMLATRDAHGLYAKVGFRPMAHPEWFMEIHRPGLYQRRRAKRA